ncbi:MAG: XrtA system polysaccharide deacetylase [Pseudomonadota bacterium]
MPGNSPLNGPDTNGQLHPKFCMSVDVEDYFQVWAFSDVIPKSSWGGFALRVGETTRRILDLFDESQTKATFFSLAWVAERDRSLIRDIVQRGHELASHGSDHAKTFDQTPQEFFIDIDRSKRTLEDITGAEIRGFRAPGFSFDARTPWAYEMLEKAGYVYSSSSHPIAHDHYGDPDGQRTPYRNGNILEVPVATAEMFGRRVSAAGGGWFRAAPYELSKRLILQARDQLSGPVVFYFHPWEIDPDQPRIASASMKSKLRHYLNLNRMPRKLRRLLSDNDVLDGQRWSRIDDMIGVSASSHSDSEALSAAGELV